MTGIEALEELRKIDHLASVPVVILTIQADGPTVMQAMKSHAADFIRKDSSVSELLSRFSAHLG
jgi:DNA-binding NarL/FixJ family response regulator